MLLWMLLLTSCGAGLRAPKPATMREDPAGKYRNTDATHGFWLVDWDPAAKVLLQTMSKHGVLLVRLDGGELTVLRDCYNPGEYHFSQSAKIRNRELIRSKTELNVKLPLGAASLGAEFKKGDMWSLDYVMVGSKEASVHEVEVDSMPPRCRGATHFVQSMVVGALRLSSAGAVSGGAAAGAFSAELGTGGSKESAVIREEGEYETCNDAATPGSHEGCRATIKVFLSPLKGRAPILPSTAVATLPLLDLGKLTVVPTELIFFPQFIIPERSISAMELSADIPPRIQKQWSALAEGETAYREILMERVLALAEIEGKRRACLSQKGGCTLQHKYAEEEAAVKKQFLRRTDAARTTVRTRRSQLASALKREYTLRETLKKNSDAAAVAYAAVALSIQHDALLDPDAPPLTTHLDDSEIFQSLRGIVERTRPNETVGWWSRYLLGNLLVETDAEAEGIALLQTNAKERWRPETVQVFFVLGNYSLDVARDAEAAFAQFHQMAEAARKFDNGRAFAIASVLSALSAFYMERYEESLALTLKSLAAPRMKPLGQHLSALAAECIEHLGGIEREPLKDVPPAIFARIADILAQRAVFRCATEEAEIAWQMIIDRAPDSLFAAAALEGLIASARRVGDMERAHTLEKRRATAYSIDSPWANALRAAGNKDGGPTDEEISRAIAALPPPMPTDANNEAEQREDFSERLVGLYSHCFGSVTTSESAARDIAVEAITRSDGRVSVSVKTVGDDVPAAGNTESVERCFVRDGPRYLKGIRKSFRVVVTSRE